MEFVAEHNGKLNNDLTANTVKPGIGQAVRGQSYEASCLAHCYIERIKTMKRNDEAVVQAVGIRYAKFKGSWGHSQLRGGITVIVAWRAPSGGEATPSLPLVMN